MSPETLEILFTVSNASVMPFWLALILAPGWRVTERLARSPWIALPPALLYAVMMAPKVPGMLAALAQPKLADIAALLGQPELALIGWLHYLAFDLTVGRMIYLDLRERRVHGLVAAPILFMVLMFGPIGFCLWLALRGVATRRAAG
ncbi:MAG: DUF4281 domain-containing protein [Myxococcales bacterium]|nr:DUF4281 domain-containing protein [Myxococcales bacterium]